MAITREEVVEWLSSQSVLEISNLVKELEEKWGVSAAAPAAAMPMMMAGAPGASGAAEEAPAEEQTEFDVVLKSFGSNKIAVIKEVRAITGLGLKEAKDLVESAPKAIKEATTKDDAEELKKKLSEAGAEVEIK